MKVVIIEDEMPAANRLVRMLDELNMGVEIVARPDSVETAVDYLQEQQPDLIFMDIQLADGLSFDIFSQVEIISPVIFVTAFDQYTLRAFKVNSIDYLLKPIEAAELETAVKKYKQLYENAGTKGPEDISQKIMQLVEQIGASPYKERLLIKRGQQLGYLKTESMAFCYADGKLCYAVDFTGVRYLLETNLSLLEKQLQPSQFFRINRHLLVHIDSIKKVHTWLGGRLKLEVHPATDSDTVVSRERVNGFKDWLGR
jgi:DNA-binding LytR/AlgR family response regulator